MNPRRALTIAAILLTSLALAAFSLAAQSELPVLSDDISVVVSANDPADSTELFGTLRMALADAPRIPGPAVFACREDDRLPRAASLRAPATSPRSPPR